MFLWYFSEITYPPPTAEQPLTINTLMPRVMAHRKTPRGGKRAERNNTVLKSGEGGNEARFSVESGCPKCGYPHPATALSCVVL